MPSEIAADFDDFWAMTPSEMKMDKKRAAIAYEKARKRATKQEIHEGYAAYWVAVSYRESQFKKHPATFLNGDNWNDAEAYRTTVPAAGSKAGERQARGRQALIDAAIARRQFKLVV